MQLTTGNYADWKQIVTQLVTPGTADVLYCVDPAIAKVQAAWAIVGTSFVVYGSFGNQGPTSAALVIDFAQALAVTNSIGITES